MKASDARILLAGATGGIGNPAAAAFAQAGASLMLVGRSPARLSAQTRELARRFGIDASRIAWHAADLTRPSAVSELAVAATSWRVDVVIHGAGVPCFGRLDTLEPEAVRLALQTNLLAPMLLTHALLPHLCSLPRAQVVFVGSALGRIGLPGYSAYSAAKFGLRGFAEALRRELGDTAVRIQYFGPRSTRTRFNDARVEAYNRATGTAMDAPEKVAHELLRLVEHETVAERFIGLPERLAVRVNGAVPTWLDRAFARHRSSLPPNCSAPPAAIDCSSAPPRGDAAESGSVSLRPFVERPSRSR